MSADHIKTISDKPVLIVGAGPSGLIVGIELARRGVPFHLIDRMADPAPWSAAIFIKSRSLEILAGLGLIDSFMERGQIVDGVDLYLGERYVGSYRFRDLDTPYPYILSIPEEQTINLLTKKLEQHSGCIERGVEFLGLEETDDGVRARLKSEEFGDYLLEAEWVVAADGYHSAVRDAIGDQFDGKDYPELWGVVDSQIDNWSHPRNLTQCRSEERTTMIRFRMGCPLGLLALTVLLTTVRVALAGMDVSLEREFQRLMDIQRRVENLPAHRELEQLRQRILSLRARIETLAREPPGRTEWERESLETEIDALSSELAANQKMIVNFREAVSRGQRERFFTDVQHRIAVFTFDDPHGTGLGDPISFLLSKKLLFSARVSSFAIVNYRQGTNCDSSDNVAYFDRVDAITKDQNFPLAVWGRLSRTERGVRIDSFLQVPSDADKSPYMRNIRLPAAMGGGSLVVRLKPDRILLQSLSINPDEISLLRAAAEQVATLRSQPTISATVTGRLGAGDYESGAYSIIDSERDWVHLRLANGRLGWTSVDQFCTGVCRTLLDVANFTNDIIALTSGLPARPVAISLTREAQAMSQQLTALVALPGDTKRATEIAEHWASGGSTVPGGAGFANLLAVARVKAELMRASTTEPIFDRIRVERRVIERIADQLAKASVADPSDLNVVENLAVLFAYIGDDRRRRLALQIAADLKAKAR